MAKEQGTIVKLIGDKPFGFIRRPDGSELFFHFSRYPKGDKPVVGDELEYEAQQDPVKPAGKQDFAANITVTKKVPAAAPAKPAKTATVLSAFSANTPQSKLDGQVVFDDPVENTDTDGNKFDEVLVAVVVTYGGKTTKGVDVECRLWDSLLGPVAQVITPENGIVFFVANVAKNAVRPYFEATLTYGRETKVISAYWGPTVPQPAAPPPAPPTELTISQGRRVVGDTVTFVTKAGDKPCKGHVEIEVSVGFNKLVNCATGEESTTSPVIWDSDDHGILNVKIVTKECYHTVIGSLTNDKAKTATIEVYDT
jgi:cold shock CspA family protein